MIGFDSTIRRKLYRALKTSFPDATIGDSDMEALAICLSKGQSLDAKLPRELRNIDISPYEKALATRSAELPTLDTYACQRRPGDTLRYYWVRATHTRKSPDGFSPFIGELAMVRVTLDKDEPRDFHTAFGVIAKGDHLIDTVFEANQKYEKHLGYRLGRVDLITPPRDVLRFGAISVFLGYRRKSDKTPSCYILEAGTATGQPKVLYLGKSLGQPINAYSGYRPTPFACPGHAYYGTLTVKNGDEPDRLHIASRKVVNGKSRRPYIDVDIRFEVQEGGLLNIWPGFLIAKASAIVLSRSLKKTIPQDCAAEALPGAKKGRGK